MTDDNRGVEIQKIEEDILRLEELKQSGALPADLADASMAALRKQLTPYQAELHGSGAISQDHSFAVGERGILAQGSIEETIFNTGDHVEINVEQQPRAKKEFLRESYMSYVLEQVSPLALSGVVRPSASNAESRMNLSAVYTALTTKSPIPLSELSLSKEIYDSLKRTGLETVDDVLKLMGPDSVDAVRVVSSFGKEGLDELREKMYSKGYPKHDDRNPSGVSALWHLNKESHLVLLGDPGSGKSTFVNFVALSMAGESLGRKDANLKALTQPLPQEQPQLWNHGILIPVRIILRDFVARGFPNTGELASAKHIWNFIESELNTPSLNEFAPLLKKELRDRGGLILFDGLDEVPEAEIRREQICSAIESFSAAFPRCRYLVTSRTYAYLNQDWKLKGFNEAVLAPFTKGQIAQFVEQWYLHIARLRSLNEQDAWGKAELLKNAIFSNDRLMGLAERPLLLTLMSSLHAWRGGTLPEEREKLYADAVDLLLDWWESQHIVRDTKGIAPIIQPSLTEWLKVDRKKVRDLLNQLAYSVHAGQSDLVGTADIPENALIAGLMNLSQNHDVKPARLIEYLSDRAGLLIPRGVGVYTFPHRTFQEYLAACYLTDHEYPELIAKLARDEPIRWRETALLAGAKAARGAADFALWSLVDALSPERENGEDIARYWGAQIAGQAVFEIADLEKVGVSTQSIIDRLRIRLLDIMEGNRLPAIERTKAGIYLSNLGDPRDEVLQIEKIVFCRVPAGEFTMGEQKETHNVSLPEFYISRFPITNAQFNQFVIAEGYKHGKFWLEAAERGNWTAEGFKGRYDDKLRNAPLDDGTPFNLPNHPVVGVSWYESLAFTRWLEEQMRAAGQFNVLDDKSPVRLETSFLICLPSEAQWEKAARGTDGRIYPWQGEFNLDNANTDEVGIESTSAVGCFPKGKSPYGLLDMSGNVTEWTRSVFKEFPYRPGDGREDLSSTEDWILRGGCFDDRSNGTRCSVRDNLDPDFRNGLVGFRVVISPFFL